MWPCRVRVETEMLEFVQTFEVRSAHPSPTPPMSPQEEAQPWQWIDECTVRFSLDGDVPAHRSLDHRRQLAVAAARQLAQQVVPGGVADDPVDVATNGAVISGDRTDVVASLLRTGPTVALVSVHFVAADQPRTRVLVTFARA